MFIDTKVCIIGAGPAGSTTSLFLSKMQIPHVIVDAAIFPRDKVCGDALDLKVLRVLNQLDPAIIEEMMQDEKFVKAWGATIIISKDKKNSFEVDRTKNNYPFFMVSKRAYFDNFLVSKMNSEYAEFLQGTKVKNLNRENDKWTIFAANKDGEVQITSELIIGADGDHSTVLRSFGERKINRENYAGALRQYWSGISELNKNNHLEIYLPKSLALAYLWIFPLPNGEANVGCGLVSDLIAKNSIDLKKLFHQLIHEDPALAHRFKNATPLEKPVGWGLPFATEKRKVYGDGYLLVGDAASLICPLTGEGVGPAMISGYTAAKFIEKALKANNFSEEIFINYDGEILKRLQTDIKNYKRLRKTSPSIFNFAIKQFSGLNLAKYYFKKKVPGWIATSKKPIEVIM